MKIACAQMDVRLGDSAANLPHALELIRKAAAVGADTVLLPETFNIGFFPRKNLAELADRDGELVKMVFGSLAAEVRRASCRGRRPGPPAPPECPAEKSRY